MLMGEQLAQVEKESSKIKTQSAMAAVKALLSFSTTALHFVVGALHNGSL